MLVQRFGSELQKDPNYVENFIESIKSHPGSCDEVWLSTDYGYPSIETHRESAKKILVTADVLRKNGFIVSMQIANTIGHGEYMSARDCSGLVYENSPVGKMVDISGRANNYCFCYNDQYFRDYIKESILAYKDIKPEKLWVDDDFRFFHHGSTDIGCFCENCVNKFNKKNGTAYTRDQVAELFMKDEKVRKLYAEFMGDSLAEFVKYVLTPFHEACPDTIFCLQYGDMKTALTANVKKALVAMKEISGHNPQTRPGGGVYEDYNPNFIVRGMLHVNLLNKQLPDCVTETMPEIENLPDVVYGKSPAGTCLTTSLLFAGAGSTDMTYAMIMRTYEPWDYHCGIFEEFSRQRPYWEKLIEVNKRTVQGGLNFVFAEDTMRQTEAHPFNSVLDFHVGVYDGVMEFLRTGIPLAFDGKKKQGVYFVTKENAHFLSEEQMLNLLENPVVCDAEVFMRINDKYQAFDCDYQRMDGATASKVGFKFTDHKVNGGTVSYPKSFYNPALYRMVNYQGKDAVEPLSYYTSSAKDITVACEGEYPYGVADAVVTSKNGVKWLVLSSDILNPTISFDRRNQLLRAVEYISNSSVKTIVDTKAQIMVLPRENKDGQVVSVSLVNMSIGETKSIRLRIKNPVGKKFKFLGQYHDEQEIKATFDGEYFVLELPSLASWTVGTVFVD